MRDLETLVRDSAPEPREEFVARLERRVEAGFAEPKALRASFRSGPLFRPALALTVTVAAMIAVVGVVVGAAVTDGTSDDDRSNAAAPTSVAPAPPSARAPGGPALPSARTSDEANDLELGPELQAAPTYSEGLAPRAGSARNSRGGSAPPGSKGGDRAIDRSTTLALRTGEDDFPDVSDGVIRTSDALGGVVQTSRVSERDGRGFASFDLRIPTAQLDDALAELSRLADVRSRTAQAEDITGLVVSAEDRRTDLRAERRSVLRALGRASGARAEDLRRRLRALRRQIAVVEADVRSLRRRADLARVQVTVESTGEAGAWTPGDALRDAGRVLQVMAGVLVIALAVLVPLALLGGLALAATRVAQRRRREAALG